MGRTFQSATMVPMVAKVGTAPAANAEYLAAMAKTQRGQLDRSTLIPNPPRPEPNWWGRLKWGTLPN